MNKTRQDLLLASLEKGMDIFHDKNAASLIQEMEEQGLIKQEENSYKITTHGKMIQVVGYKAYEKAQKYEDKILNYSSIKTKIIRVVLLVKLMVLIFLLLLILFSNLMEEIVEYVWNIL